MSSVATIAGGIALAGSVYGSSQASKAQSKSDAANAANTANTNAQNYQMFREGRGALNTETGYANAILPEYFKGQEAALAGDANTQYNSVMGQNNALIAGLQSQLGQAAPAQQASMQALLGRYNGSNLAQYLSNAQPTYNGRLDLARTQMAGIDTGLSGVIAQLNASRAAQGFLGGSTFDQARLAAATIGARQQAAGTFANAQLANYQDERGLRDSDLNNRQDLSQLTSGFQNWANLQAAPLQQQIAGYQAAMAPYSFFRIGQNAFQNQNLPQVSPTISTGQAVGQAAGALGQTGLNYALNQRLVNQYATPQQSAYIPPTGGNYGSAYTGFNNNSIPLQY